MYLSQDSRILNKYILWAKSEPSTRNHYEDNTKVFSIHAFDNEIPTPMPKKRPTAHTNTFGHLKYLHVFFCQVTVWISLTERRNIISPEKQTSTNHTSATAYHILSDTDTSTDHPNRKWGPLGVTRYYPNHLNKRRPGRYGSTFLLKYLDVRILERPFGRSKILTSVYFSFSWCTGWTGSLHFAYSLWVFSPTAPQ